jgi:AAHS family 4-hydroxybenzoate transporter-like MFS transporter
MTPDRPDSLDITTLIDPGPLGSYRLGLLIMLGLTVIMDGFDVQAMGYVAPAIIRDWGIDPASLTAVFGAGMSGMLVGSLVLSLAADHSGRRPVIIGATLFFAACMLVTAQVTSLTQLLVIRFTTGLGLGAIMPNAVALAGEFAPRKTRNTMMMLVSCGFTVGAVIGGLIAAVLIPFWGWRSVFYLGGAIPLILAALMLRFLPESLQFQVLRGRGLDRVRDSLRRMAPGRTIDPTIALVAGPPSPPGAPLPALFRDGRAAMTVLLWGINLLNLITLYFLSNWLPTIAKGMGLSTSTAVLVGTTLQLGGVVGTLVLGPLIDRRGFIAVLIPSFLVAAVSILLIGQPGLSIGALLLVVIVTGFSIVGCQPALVALAAGSYPTSLRSTGTGWALGVARVGSILGPVLGGILIGLHWSNQQLFQAVAVPAMASAALVVMLGRLPKRRD